MPGGRYLSDSKCIFEVELYLCTHTETDLIREELQQERSQKDYAQILWIQFIFHQTDAEKTEKTESQADAKIQKEQTKHAWGKKTGHKTICGVFGIKSQVYDHVLLNRHACFGEWVHVFMTTTVQLNIPLSRHSYVLDQCYYYSSVIQNVVRLPF